MVTWRREVAYRLALGAAFIITGNAFDHATDGLPYAPVFCLLYYGGAATVDLFMFRITRLFVSGALQKDVEALCIASIVTNALGFALYVADSPPSIYNWIIKGINYVLAIRLTIMGGGDVFNDFDWRGLVRGAFNGRVDHQAKEAKR